MNAQLDTYGTSGGSPPLDEPARQAGYDLVTCLGIAKWGDEAIQHHAQYLHSRGMAEQQPLGNGGAPVWITYPTRVVQYSFIQGMCEGQAVLAQRTSHIEPPPPEELLAVRRDLTRRNLQWRGLRLYPKKRSTKPADATKEYPDLVGSDAAVEAHWRKQAVKAWDWQKKYSQRRFAQMSPKRCIRQAHDGTLKMRTILVDRDPIEVPVDPVEETSGNSVEGTICYLSKQISDNDDGLTASDMLHAHPITPDDKYSISWTWEAHDPADDWAEGMDAEQDLLRALDAAMNKGRAKDRHRAIAAILDEATGEPEFVEPLYAYVQAHEPEFFDRQDQTIAGNRRKGNRRPKKQQTAAFADGCDIEIVA